MIALFIGRFQPFHNGHLHFLQKISNQYNKIIIGIGSSQYCNTQENPFTYEERRQMIEKSLQKVGLFNMKIVSIPDIHNPPRWVEHVLSIVSNFDVVLSNNSLTKKLFSEKGFTVKETILINRDKFAGKEVRKRIINNKSWEDLVPESVVEIITKIEGVKRLKNLSDSAN
jgi:nicotinamide-nucleotide adenylyltransferase